VRRPVFVCRSADAEFDDATVINVVSDLLRNYNHIVQASLLARKTKLRVRRWCRGRWARVVDARRRCEACVAMWTAASVVPLQIVGLKMDLLASLTRKEATPFDPVVASHMSLLRRFWGALFCRGYDVVRMRFHSPTPRPRSRCWVLLPRLDRSPVADDVESCSARTEVASSINSGSAVPFTMDSQIWVDVGFQVCIGVCVCAVRPCLHL
jgi:hypothetical protein